MVCVRMAVIFHVSFSRFVATECYCHFVLSVSVMQSAMHRVVLHCHMLSFSVHFISSFSLSCSTCGRSHS